MALELDVSPSSKWPEEKRSLLGPYEYITKRIGKQIRTKLIASFNHWLQVPEDVTKRVGSTIEMLHNASLLIDDIEDNSILRRGIPVAHKVFGIPITINCANYIYFLSQYKIMTEFPKDKVLDAITIHINQMIELHRGQGMEIDWRENSKCPTEQEYIEMISLKTGGLFGLGIQLLQLFSNYKKDLSRILFLFGVIFQIRDDYLNLKSSEYKENKSFCEDLTEGKFSYPIVHAILSHPESTVLQNILRQKTTDVEVKQLAVNIMEEYGSFEHCKKVLKKYDQEAREEIEKLGGNKYLLEFLDAMKFDD